MAIDKICLPAKTQNVANSLPTRPSPSCDGATLVKLCPSDASVAIETELCSGIEERAVSLTVEAVIPKGAVVYTRSCPDENEFDHTILCDPASLSKVVAVVNYNSSGIPATVFYNIDSTPFVGDTNSLEHCEINVESDPVDWCVDGFNFTQWIVKSNGAPDGTVYWTDELGQMVAAPSGGTKGACEAGCAILREPYRLDGNATGQATPILLDGSGNVGSTLTIPAGFSSVAFNLLPQTQTDDDTMSNWVDVDGLRYYVQPNCGFPNHFPTFSTNECNQYFREPLTLAISGNVYLEVWVLRKEV